MRKRYIAEIGLNSWRQLCSILGHATDDDIFKYYF